MKSWRNFLVGIILIAFILVVGCSKTVAIVNGEKITEKELYSELDKKFGKLMLEELILRKLVQQEAEKKKIEVSKEDLDKSMREIRKAFSPGQFNKMLKEKGVTREEFKLELKRNLLLKKMIVSEISEEEKREYYDKNKERLVEIEASHILVKTREDAEKVMKDLKNSKDFKLLASQYSIDPATRDKGGYIGYFSRGQMVPPFEEAAFKTKPGFLSPIVKTAFGYHIIKVTDRKASYEQLKEKVEEEMVAQRARDYLEDLKDKAKLEYKRNYSQG